MTNSFVLGDALTVLRTMPDESVHCCVTSPPYWGLRDYGADRQIGLEPTPEEYTAKLVEVFHEVRRVLRNDGTLWLNLGDSYCSGNRDTYDQVSDNKGKRGVMNVRPQMPAGLKPKDMVGIPWRVAFALQADGWWLRSDIIWAKPNPMPESVTDRPTKSHEYIFLLAKSEQYHYDGGAIREASVSDHPSGNGYKRGQRLSYRDEDGARGSDSPWLVKETRNKRTVWTIATQPLPEAHFATFPRDLVLPCVLAGCPAGGTVLDPFSGAGTTALVAKENGRHWIGIEINPKYNAIAEKRTRQDVLFGAALEVL